MVCLGLVWILAAVHNLSYVDLEIKLLVGIFFYLESELEEPLTSRTNDKRMQRGVKVVVIHRLHKCQTFYVESILDLI